MVAGQMGKALQAVRLEVGELDCVGGWVVSWLKHDAQSEFQKNRGEVIRNKRRVLEHGGVVMSRDTMQ
ncbi:hypothetical protein A2U01_0024937 [Trifolium medium]|uniref:Uncharacterized protein n=1 Tax=Trifolium medium TaxID=97028 RepID=A0A392NXR9_9FABA|nr:hypothetical protein [Trifolium medium]